MDTPTQGLLGAAVAYGLFRRQLGARALLIGAVGGVLADADGLIRSVDDPLLRVEFHRHFTHSLVFMPVGAAIAALPWMLSRWGRERWWAVLAAALLGYATHAPLDCCTSYGTQLLWPFTNERLAWHLVSVVDPVFSLALILGILVGVLRRSGRPALVAVVFCVLYLLLGLVQRNRALDVQAEIAAARGHLPVRRKCFPTLANQWVWRSLYEEDGRFHSDAIRVPWFGSATFAPGGTVEKLTADGLPAEVRRDSRTARDFERFHWFSDDWVFEVPGEPGLYGDARYSRTPGGLSPLWGVRLDPSDPARPTEWVGRAGGMREPLEERFRGILGKDDRFRPVP